MPFIGVDVSKKKLDCALLIDPQEVKTKSRAVANTAKGFKQLVGWACRVGCCEVKELSFILEPSGVYHEQAAHELYRAGAQVCLVNPAQLRNFAKGLAVHSKNDALDRMVLARYGYMVRPRAWQPPPPEVLELQSLIKRLESIEADHQREANRLEKATAAHEPKAVRDSLRYSLEFLEQQRRELERLIDDHIDRHPQLKRDQELLESIPGVGESTAKRMLVVLRAHSFGNAREAAAWAGLVPVEYQSGTSVHRRPRLSKVGDGRVRAKLYWPAVAATRFNPDVRALYERLLASGKCKMSAIGAAMRKLVHICFGVLKHQQPYRAQGGVLT